MPALCRIVRGLAFAAVDGARSGHPGGSSSKTEMALALLASGVLRCDATRPKHPGRDRVVWSAGHCSPLFHALISLVYECVRRRTSGLCASLRETITYPEHLPAFRGLNGFRGGSFRAWLLRTVTNACYDELRRRRRRPTTPL